MSYEPKPIDTSDIKLGPPLESLTERLAENTHEVWALQRIQDGWRPGPKRDDQAKEHPCLIPYGELPESEKEYDRKTALETLKTIQKLGYQITPPPDSSSKALEALLTLCRMHKDERQHWTGDDYARLADKALRLGEPLWAYDLATAGLEAESSRSRLKLRQIQGLALARSEATARANGLLRQLYDEGHRDDETVGLLGRTHKDLGIAFSDRYRSLTERLMRNSAEDNAPDAAKSEGAAARKEADDCREAARTHLHLALRLYEQAYEDSKRTSIWTGINAATIALWMGDEAKAKAIAGQLRERCDAMMAAAGSGFDNQESYWVRATMGEACLILGEPGALVHYRHAAKIGDNLRLYGDMASTRLQARRILEHLRFDPHLVDRELRVPKVAVFVGHMIDHPFRPKEAGERFPQEMEHDVKERIRSRLEKHGVRIGYSSGACGSDILFLEALLEIGGEAHVILPYKLDQFIQDSVAIIPGGNWPERLESILAKAHVSVASPHRLKWGDVSFEFTNRMLHGFAASHARYLDTELVRLAVWDKKKGDGPGGTSSTVRRWKKALRHNVDIISLAKLPQRDLRLFADGDPGSFPMRADETVTEGMPAFDVGASSVGVLFSSADSTTSNLPAVEAVPDQSAAWQALAVQETPAADEVGKFRARIAAILFADVVGFSKLTEDQIPKFSLHFLNMVGELLKPCSTIKNTWGDGLYVVFNTVKSAAQFALDLRDRVAETPWEDHGLPKDFNVRIGLHAGPVYLGIDPVTRRPNCMGTCVSHAARIEPITPPGEVYASESFAALAADEGLTDFRIHYIGQMKLHKNFGIHPTYHVHGRL